MISKSPKQIIISSQDIKEKKYRTLIKTPTLGVQMHRQEEKAAAVFTSIIFDSPRPTAF